MIIAILSIKLNDIREHIYLTADEWLPAAIYYYKPVPLL